MATKRKAKQLGVFPAEHKRAARSSAGSTLQSAKRAERAAERGRCTEAVRHATTALYLIGIANCELSSAKATGVRKARQKLTEANRRVDTALINCTCEPW